MNKNTTYLVLILLVLVLFSGVINEVTGLAILPKCKDPDGKDRDSGISRSTCIKRTGTGTGTWCDRCADAKTVSEVRCKSKYQRERKNIACPTGTYCSDGACITKQLNPDLVIEDMSYSYPYIKIKYCNIGKGTSEEKFLIRIMSTEKTYYTDPLVVPPLNACSIIEIESALLGIDMMGTFSFITDIDYNNKVMESNEENNHLERFLGIIKSPKTMLILELSPPDTTYDSAEYHCDENLCKRDSGCTGENCLIFNLNFLEVINNPDIITKIYMYSRENEPAVTLFDIPIGPWYSFYFLNDFLNKESLKWRKKPIDTTIEIKGPYNIDEKVPENYLDLGYDYLVTFFENKASKLNIDLSHYDAIHFVYFDSTTEQADFRSTASKSKQYTFNNIFTLIDNINLQILTVTHETGHLFGAIDKYEGSQCKIPDGIPNPNKIPLYPQDEACIMCEMIYNEYGGWGTPDDLKKFIICETTAKEIGWI